MTSEQEVILTRLQEEKDKMATTDEQADVYRQYLELAQEKYEKFLTLDKVEVRLSNLMAFDATVAGNWGCEPRHYPEILEAVHRGKIVITPLVEHHPMSQLNALLFEDRHGRRPVLIPDFDRV